MAKHDGFWKGVLVGAALTACAGATAYFLLRYKKSVDDDLDADDFDDLDDFDEYDDLDLDNGDDTKGSSGKEDEGASAASEDFKAWDSEMEDLADEVSTGWAMSLKEP